MGLPRVWTTKLGERVKIRDMTTSHLENAAAFLKRLLDDHSEGGEVYQGDGEWAWMPGLDGDVMLTRRHTIGEFIEAMESEVRRRDGES